MTSEQLQFTEDFALNDFIRYVQDKNRVYNYFADDLLRHICLYGMKHYRKSKDSLAYYLSDIVPDITFREAAAFFKDESLTENGQAEKWKFWEEKRW